MKISNLVSLLQMKQSRPSIAGNEVFDTFLPASRYCVDFAADRNGWEQFDTPQDAAYFGVWINRQKLMTLTYAEGDWSLVKCRDQSSFDRELGSMIMFYQEC